MKVIRQEGILLPGASGRSWESVYPELISPQRLLYRDDFVNVGATAALQGRAVQQSPAPVIWDNAGASLEIHADDYVRYNSAAGVGAGSLVHDAAMADHGEVMVRAEFGNFADNGRVGVAWRGTGFSSGNSWVAYIGTTGLVVARIMSGVLTTVSTTPVAVADGQRYNIRARWAGDKINVWGAGVKAPEITDATWATQDGFGIFIRKLGPKILNWRAGR